jgi:hypothetical protein
VEHLSEQEMMNTSLELVSAGTKRKGEVQQSYVVAVGPGFEPAKWGFGVGDRVMVVGTYNPVPVPADNGRELGIVEPHNIRGVLVEEPKCCCGDSGECCNCECE